MMMQSVRILTAAALVGAAGNAMAQEPPPDYVGEWGGQGTEDGQFGNPRTLAVDHVNGFVYVTDLDNARVQKFDLNGAFVTKWGSTGHADGEFDQPEGIAVDGTGTYVYVTDRSLTNRVPRVQKFDSDGNHILTWGAFGPLDEQFNFCTGIAVDESGNVYVADTGNNRIQKFDADGEHLLSIAGIGPLDPFNQPYGVAADAAGNVYVADSFNHRVVKFDSDGNYQATWGSLGVDDGGILIAIRVGVDPSGFVYVCDRNNHRMYKHDSDGTRLTVWGSEGSGPAQFVTPHGVGADAEGNVYVVDTGNHRVQKFAASVTGVAGAASTLVSLAPSRPNPFRVGTNLHYSLEQAERIRFAVYDVSGRLVRVLEDGWNDAGSHFVRWDAGDRFGRRVAPGVYFARLEHGRGTLTRRVVRAR